MTVAVGLGLGLDGAGGQRDGDGAAAPAARSIFVQELREFAISLLGFQCSPLFPESGCEISATLGQSPVLLRQIFRRKKWVHP
ncbi:hypothetical protein [Streptomyces rochei]|uniref:hypothetical protein n=1 Tax=Streptomyces rochei TaxID=1928 RepID=UPI003465CDD4